MAGHLQTATDRSTAPPRLAPSKPWEKEADGLLIALLGASWAFAILPLVAWIGGIHHVHGTPPTLVRPWTPWLAILPALLAIRAVLRRSPRSPHPLLRRMVVPVWLAPPFLAAALFTLASSVVVCQISESIELPRGRLIAQRCVVLPGGGTFHRIVHTGAMPWVARTKVSLWFGDVIPPRIEGFVAHPAMRGHAVTLRGSNKASHGDAVDMAAFWIGEDGEVRYVPLAADGVTNIGLSPAVNPYDCRGSLPDRAAEIDWWLAHGGGPGPPDPPAPTPKPRCG